jgi:hypothetical protein
VVEFGNSKAAVSQVWFESGFQQAVFKFSAFFQQQFFLSAMFLVGFVEP